MKKYWLPVFAESHSLLSATVMKEPIPSHYHHYGAHYITETAEF
jgi:hypothetical protein